MSFIKNITKISKQLVQIVNNTSSNILTANVVCSSSNNWLVTRNTRTLHTTSCNNDLMEFFDDQKNWNQNEVRVGRSWRTEELRLKSNSDLHKLWFILLKERNMLLTMEYESAEQMKLFPNPERIDKVKESMENLESVVRERNEAYHLLETGTSGERPSKLARNIFGLNYNYRMSEHVIPKFMNTSWKKKMYFYKPNMATYKFLRLYREKLFNEKRKKRNRNFNHVVQLLKRFPNLDLEAVKEEFPTVDLEKAKNHNRARGHFVPAGSD